MDRNTSVVSSTGTMGKSLSVRRAWIEMTDDVSTGGQIKGRSP